MHRNHILLKCLLITLLFLAWAQPAQAAKKERVLVDPLFSKGMVIQQGQASNIWGRVGAGQTIKIKLDQHTVTTKADKNGRWRTTLPAMKAGGPHQIEVTAGQRTQTITDVMIGEVWICGGQSNMSFAGTRMHKEGVFDSAKLEQNPNVRINAGWGWRATKDFETIKKLPITPFYFGRELHKTRNVTIGLVVIGKGGTSAHTWMPREDMESNSETKPILDDIDRRVKAQTTKQPEPGLPVNPKLGWPSKHNRAVSVNWKGALARLPYTAKGIVWWQGENDIALNARHEPIFRQLIRTWRTTNGGGETMPFVYVQLPTYMDRRTWGKPASTRRKGIAPLRDAQRRVLTEPNTAMVVSLDIHGGGGIHPTAKDQFGKRLADTVERFVYDKQPTYSGPLFKSMKITGGSIEITFDQVGDGLALVKDKPLLGFKIAGKPDPNGTAVFHPATGKIKNANTIVIRSDKVAAPVAVRYAWHENPPHSLINSLGLPASPFRTDDWPLFPMKTSGE